MGAMKSKTTKKRVVRTSFRAVRPSKRKPVRGRMKTAMTARARIETLRAFLIRTWGIVRRAVPTKLMHPLVRQPGSLHPYMRTMFLSLIVGSILVFWSAIYYVEVDAATEPLLSARQVTFAQATNLMNTPFVELVETLEAQDVTGVDLKLPPREYLRLKAQEEGYDYELLNRIAFCESGWRMIKNRRSTAFGYFQIIDGSERLTPQYRSGLSKTDPYANIDMALYLYGRQGTLPWLASRRCWAR
jgi:hypothetical protein